MRSNGKPRVMITGIGGAIGVHVAAYLLEKTDWQIIGIDSFKTEHKGAYDRIMDLLPDEFLFGRFAVYTHDLNAPFTPREIEKIGRVDYILNLASRSDVGNSIEDPLPFVRNNTELMLTMLEYARIAKPEVFLHFSTDEVYGPAERESAGHEEWDPILPSNPYSASKACQEALAIAWWRSYGVPLILTNTMNNFGEMQAPSKFPAMIQQKIEAGETIDVHVDAAGRPGSRYYLHSRNTADALLFILKNVKALPHAHGDIDMPVRLNIVGDKQIENDELVQIISGLMGKQAHINMVGFHENNPGHDLHYGLDGSRLAACGWKAPFGFEEGMKRTIAWQKAHPEWMK